MHTEKLNISVKGKYLVKMLAKIIYSTCVKDYEDARAALTHSRTHARTHRLTVMLVTCKLKLFNQIPIS